MDEITSFTRVIFCYCLGQCMVVASHRVLHSLHQPFPGWLPHLGKGEEEGDWTDNSHIYIKIGKSMSVVHTLRQLCLSHCKSISLKQSLGEWGLAERMVSRSPGRTPREVPRLFHLPARLVTAEITSRRSSSPASRSIYIATNYS